MTALSGDARERLAASLASHRLVTPRQCMCGEREPYDERDAGFHRPEWHIAHALAQLLPVVAELADLRAAEELERLADERVWTTEHDNEVVSVRDLYEQVARLRGELEPVVFDDFPPDEAAAALTTPTAPEGATP